MPALLPPAVPAGAMSSRPQPTIRAGAVVLRPWTPDDVPAVVTAYADPDIRRWHIRSADAAEALDLVARWARAWAAETAAGWAITDPVDGRVLGRVGFRTVDLAEGEAELAYWVLAAERRRGVARHAVLALTAWSFDDLGLERLTLLHSVANPGSCAVATACSYLEEGTMRGGVRHEDGRHDMHLHARLRPVPAPAPAAAAGAVRPGSGG